MVFDPAPQDKATNISPSLSELSFNIADYQGDSMNYTVVTYPDIGSDQGFDVPSDRYTLNVNGLDFGRTYTWTVSVADGVHRTNVTYEFATHPSNPPNQTTPLLITNTTSGDLICYNQTTTDLDGDKVTNVYNWYRNDTSLTNLSLPFETNSSKEIKDYSGYNNNGVILGGVAWTNNGKVGGAYEFNGGFITIPGSETIDGGGNWAEITVEHWIYLTAVQSNTRTIARVPSYEIGLGGGGNRIFAGIWISTGNPMTSGYSRIIYDTPLQTNMWYHIAFTYKNGSGLKLYVNGVTVATGVPSVWGKIQQSGFNPLYIGWFDYYKGMIDEVRIYPKSLSAEQIYQRYRETKDGLSNNSAIIKAETAFGDIWRCEVTPNDSYQDGVTESSNTVMIAKDQK